MKNLFLIPLVLATFLFTACTSETDKVETHTAHTHENQPPILKLDNGKKWRADETTTAGIENMQKVMQNFMIKADFSSINGYQQLGKELRGELNDLYRNCTMKGAAHDELHKFIVPIEADIKVLQGNDAGAASNAQLRIEERLMMYQTFFE